MTDRFGLGGQTALVTGAARGIGAAMATALAEAGADIILWGRSEQSLSETAAACAALGRQVSTVVGDLSEPEAAGRTARELVAERQVDILVNNAGMISRAPALEVDFSDWRRVLSTNLDSAFVLSQAVGAPMVRRREGSIINTASLLSFQGGINVASYTASKHALAGMTKALANEWAPHQVTVNAIAPGYIATENTSALRADEEREAAIRARIPAGRWGTPEDLTGAVVFLAGPSARYVTGHTLVVDGGWMAR
ncbi:2-deoxy-D-gluconate 3-dehydrogenase [Phycicoccus badiiscoriae]|uniref:2-deoxy-D-gluconate 3-dehydrogenase n=1 Tax=Pedococcus badiiscoriae TaxID=642776 RepID=A0A852WIR2_9MICO|nr:SDR family oxidoreductase [Pedococcus badiiscoriae]NYG08649.1 2-deoxy-D-gluconate 3-dehydrogenase [Pedococcus badiiscoriae]